MKLYTFGHGANERETIAQLVRTSAIEKVEDVRSVPKSRAHPQFARESIEQWLPELARATYEWRPALGGFRRARPDSLNVGLRHPSFRGYADYMESEDFQSALASLMHDAGEGSTAVMCSETLWWRCHRRLIADAATLLHGAEVVHLAPHGKPAVHVVTPAARRVGEVLVYDGET